MDEEKQETQSLTESLAQLDATDQELLRMYLENPRITQEEAGEYLGLRRETVNIRVNKPHWRRLYARLKMPAYRILQEARAVAARRVVQHISSRDERVSLAASLAILGRNLEHVISDAEREEAEARANQAQVIEVVWDISPELPTPESATSSNMLPAASLPDQASSDSSDPKPASKPSRDR